MALIDRWVAAFDGLPAGSLAGDEEIDREIVLGELAAMRFAETELRAGSWDPLSWVYLLGEGIHLLMAREFAPLGVRLASAAERIEGIPAVVAAARERLVGSPGRRSAASIPRLPSPSSRASASSAGRRLLPARAPARKGSRPRSGFAWSWPSRKPRPPSTASRPTFGEVVLPAARGEGRLGPDLFAAQLRHTLRVDMSPDALEERARREYVAVRGEMVRLAQELWTVLRPGEPMPTDEGPLVRGALDTIAERHPAPEDLLEFCRAELARVEAFCRERDVVALAEEPLAIEWTPVFLRAFGGAMLSSPGPLDRGLRSYFYVTPTPDDWTPEQVESYLREDNDRMLVTLVIHEAVPGHYLQLAYANRSPSFVRAAMASGVFAEGWAVYVTQVLMDLRLRRRRSGPPPRPLEALPARRSRTP